VKRRRRVFLTRGEREMKHVQLPPDGEVLPLDPTTIFFRPADDDPLAATSQRRSDLARARRCLHRSMDGGGRSAGDMGIVIKTYKYR
jgi:hypothetical protein